MNPDGLVLSLCDATANMVEPWMEAGYQCMTVDLQHKKGEKTKGNLTRVGADVRTWLPPRVDYAIVFAFPPCTHLAKGGARYYKDKGLSLLAEALTLVERCRAICEWSDAPYMLENPVGQLSTYWRHPDHIFQPWEYAGYLDDDREAYTKMTCLWTGNGFIMPEKRPLDPVHGSMLDNLGATHDRSFLRSVTPEGFARAVFEANHYGED